MLTTIECYLMVGMLLVMELCCKRIEKFSSSYRLE